MVYSLCAMTSDTTHNPSDAIEVYKLFAGSDFIQVIGVDKKQYVDETVDEKTLASLPNTFDSTCAGVSMWLDLNINGKNEAFMVTSKSLRVFQPLF